MGNEWKDYSNLSILNAQCNNHKNVCLFYCTQKGERNMPELFGLGKCFLIAQILYNIVVK